MAVFLQFGHWANIYYDGVYRNKAKVNQCLKNNEGSDVINRTSI